MEAKVIIVCGSTGAGKSTYSLDICQEEDAIHFSIDEWMQTLFMPDVKSDISFDWAIERVERCEVQIWKVAQRLLRQNISVVLDLGFTIFDQREKFRKLADDAGFTAQVHYVHADPEIRRERVVKRNQEQGKTFAFEVTMGMFDFMEQRFEEPGDAEKHIRVQSSLTASH